MLGPRQGLPTRKGWENTSKATICSCASDPPGISKMALVPHCSRQNLKTERKHRQRKLEESKENKKVSSILKNRGKGLLHFKIELLLLNVNIRVLEPKHKPLESSDSHPT